MIVKHNPQVIIRRIKEEQLKEVIVEEEEVELVSFEETNEEDE